MSERELLKRAYKLLDDLVTDRTMERYDVQKWLEDATLILGTEQSVYDPSTHQMIRAMRGPDGLPIIEQ